MNVHESESVNLEPWSSISLSMLWEEYATRAGDWFPCWLGVKTWYEFSPLGLFCSHGLALAEMISTDGFLGPVGVWLAEWNLTSLSG